ncbi:MAG: LysR family transcriptional regulator [Lachnospiraceae bacterium]|nr:LysR family transcriptional regulator [Lachnospiraceae bacterium]
MDAKKLEILMTAVDLGSFSKASQVVGYTQSGLTHLVNSLEREIGFQIIFRNHNGISLTPQGEELMPAIRDYLSANTFLNSKIQTIKNEKCESIRIAAYSSIAMHWMPEILYRFRRICPHVDVDLRMVDNALEPFELLKEGRTDIVFASKQNCGSYQWIPLYQEKMYAILPQDYPVKDSTSFPLKEMEGMDFLMPYGRFDIDVHAAFEKNGVHVREKASYVDDETVIRMVEKGFGVSMMTELMIRGRTDDVRCIPVEPEVVRELGMGLPKEGEVTNSVSRLRDCAMAYINEKKMQNQQKMG